MKAFCTKARMWALGSAVAFGLWGSPQAFAASPQEPAITVKTNYYELSGSDNIFTFCFDVDEPIYLDVDCGFGSVEYLIEPSQEGTWVPCVVDAKGEVKMYTDKPEVINYLYCQGGHITDIDLSKLTALQILDLSNNELKKLDLSHNEELQYLDLGTNPFDEEPLYIGKKPSLMVLEIEAVGNLSPDFTLTNFPELVSFAAFSNYSLTKLDTSACPKLQRLSADVTKISSLDLSNNPDLRVLNVSDTYITSLDLSKNPKLEQLFASHEGSFASNFKISSLDVSSNPRLLYLFISGNAINSIDITNCSKLLEFKARGNYLESFDYSGNPSLYSVDISNNCLDFATLPLDPPFVNDYYYQQRSLPVALSFPVGATLNLSNRVLREDTDTEMRLMAVSQSDITSPYPLSDDYYEYSDGILKFNKECVDSVYAEFTNPFFPDCVLTTTKFMVKTQELYGLPSLTSTFTPAAATGEAISFGLGVEGANESAPLTLFVDFGDGVQVPVQVSCQVPTEANVVGTRAGTGPIRVYVNDGEGLTGLLIDGYPLYDIDVENAPLLRSLTLIDTDLSYINLKKQRCLQNLQMNGNRFSSLDLTASELGYDKNVLYVVDLSNNGLTDLNFVVASHVKSLNVSHNQLSELAVDQAYNLLTLDISYNKFNDILISNLDSLATLKAAGNHLNYLELPWQNTLRNLDIRENDFTFSNLPCLPGELDDEYLYAPQNAFMISNAGPGCNLSGAGVNVDGVPTQFVWRKEDGTKLSEGTDYTISGGVVNFLNYNLGKVYCEMTNSRFPELTLVSSVMLVSEPPTNVIGWMDVADKVDPETTMYLSLAANTDGKSIYIDWSGEGLNYEEYALQSSYTVFPVSPMAGRRAKVYSYDTPDFLTVFSVTSVPMKKADFTEMKWLTDLTVMDAGTSDIVFPDTDKLESLTIDGNGFKTLDATRLKNLKVLSAGSNNITSIDLSQFPLLQVVSLVNNGMTEITIDNPDLWHLDLMANEFEQFSLAGLPSLHQVRLSDNKLKSIDINGPNLLRVLRIERNCFDFSTLPLVPETVTDYNYTEQANIPIVANGLVVDLSSQAAPHGVETEFYWCYDEPYYDGAGSLYAEFLVPGEDYTITNGVTTFKHEVANVCCLMLNALFPRTYLQTDLINVTQGMGVEAVEAVAPSVSIDGLTLTVDAENGTPFSVFSVDGKTVVSGVVTNGAAKIALPSAGIYVVKAGDTTTRLMAK